MVCLVLGPGEENCWLDCKAGVLGFACAQALGIYFPSCGGDMHVIIGFACLACCTIHLLSLTLACAFVSALFSCAGVCSGARSRPCSAGRRMCLLGPDAALFVVLRGECASDMCGDCP